MVIEIRMRMPRLHHSSGTTAANPTASTTPATTARTRSRPLSLLASGLDRVVAVVAGVVLAVGFAAVVPLEWWSLGILILVSITIGQYLRLRSNLVEVAISAMLVLGVGAIGAEAAAWQRIAETLVGAAVGIVATLLFPPKVPSGDAGRAIDGLADAVSELLVRAADELSEMAEAHRDRLPGATRVWLDDSRRVTHDIPRVGAALLRAEEGRRLNLRAVRTPHVEPGLRQGMEALEHSSVAVRRRRGAAGIGGNRRGCWRARAPARARPIQGRSRAMPVARQCAS